MPHSIGVGFIGANEYSDYILNGILKNDIIPKCNIHIAEKDPLNREHYLGLGLDCVPDISASVLRSEILFLSSDRKEFPTLLSSICGTTCGRVIVSLIPGRTAAYIQERVAKAEAVVCVEGEDRKDGTHISRLTYSERFPLHMKCAIEDIFRTIGEIEITNNS